MGCLMEFYQHTKTYENVFQNPQFLRQTLSLFTELSTLGLPAKMKVRGSSFEPNKI
jgi:hypothetical protein